MISKQPLERRIVIAFVLMTLLVSGVFSLGIVAIVHFIEEHLVSQELDRELALAMDEGINRDLPQKIDSSTRLYSSRPPSNAIPKQFTQLEEGFSEVLEDDKAYYAFKRTIYDQEYILVQEQHEFEARENVLFGVVLAGFLLSVIGAWGLGRLLARRVMSPVTRLALQVRHRDQLLPLAPALASEYPDDEVGHLAAAFDSTLGQLRVSLERERLFTSDVSHEFRTPLMVIASSCELLLASGKLAVQQQEQVTRVVRASAEMIDLVETLLMLARAKQQDTATAGRVTLATIAEEQSKRWGPQIEAKGLGFTFQQLDVGEANYNAAFLRTVLSNLMRNALHYAEFGSISLIVEKDAFRVEDTGVGIPLNQQNLIFQPFVRGDQSRGEGLGLGLSLVKRICEHQGWQVQVNSKSPTGCCFIVSLEPGVALS